MVIFYSYASLPEGTFRTFKEVESECFPTKKDSAKNSLEARSFRATMSERKWASLFTWVLGASHKHSTFLGLDILGRGRSFWKFEALQDFSSCGTHVEPHIESMSLTLAHKLHRPETGINRVILGQFRSHSEFCIFSCNMLQPLYKWKTQWFLDILLL